MLLEDLRLSDSLKIRNVKIFQSGKLTTQPKTCELNSLSAGPNSNSLLHVMDAATNTQFLVDTGAEVSLVPPTEPELEKTPSLSLIAANGSPIKSYGTRCMDLHISKNNTANIFTAKTTGFHCGTNPTAVSLHFLQTNNANIECKNCKKIFTGGFL